MISINGSSRTQRSPNGNYIAELEVEIAYLLAREKPRHEISAAFDKAALESNTTTKYYRGMWGTYGRKEGSSAGALVDPKTQGPGWEAYRKKQASGANPVMGQEPSVLVVGSKPPKMPGQWCLGGVCPAPRHWRAPRARKYRY
jgi:hypothetical protein